ncbi:hypothetical protein [Gulosibacter sp. ACHW.36C]|uniref:Uncharacterized protein n=1 Tax=Gulosibacter sediminis TaxID=1729695 RepID=A0ABY4MWT7_9MICO|nr:hypothetical protein [Gulosibacter sediminis]UQN14881.1 hypothetical protein M3M28_12695 [Gulosibacter sediminis]
MRGTAVLLLALLAGAGLTSCVGEDVHEESFSIVNVGAAMPDIDEAVRLDAPEQFIEVPGARLQVTSVAAVAELSGAVANEIDLATIPVRAPSGEAYYLAEVSMSEPQSITVNSGETFDWSLSISAKAFNSVALSAEACRGFTTCLVVVTGPEVASPSDFTLETVTGGVPQQLSLVTGEATSELTYFPKMHAEYEPVWWEFEGDPAADDETVGGYVAAVFYSPMVANLPTPVPETGFIYVGVDIEAIELFYVDDTSQVSLVLDDGTRVEAANNMHAAFDEEGSITWFAVPVETETLTFEMYLSTNSDHVGDASQTATLVAD